MKTVHNLNDEKYRNDEILLIKMTKSNMRTEEKKDRIEF